MATVTNLDCKDICAIIIACGEAGVSQFSYKGLKISIYFDTQGPEDVPEPQISKETMEFIAEKSNEKETAYKEQDYIDDLAITDHQKYEELIMQEELTDAEPDDSEA